MHIKIVSSEVANVGRGGLPVATVANTGVGTVRDVVGNAFGLVKMSGYQSPILSDSGLSCRIATA